MNEFMCDLPHDEKPVIALDYDDTFSTDPSAWMKAMAILKKAGYRVIGVTLRNREQHISDTMFHMTVESIVYCGGNAKKQVMLDFGHEIAVWIDDKPEYILDTHEKINGEPFDKTIPKEVLEPVMVDRYDRPPQVRELPVPQGEWVECTCGGGMLTCSCSRE